MQDWVFFGANLVFTAFNAWLAWESWRRQRASDAPAADVEMHWSAEHQVWQIETRITNPTKATWKCLRASVRRPRKAVLYYPFALMVAHPASGEPWVPAPIDWSSAPGMSVVALSAQAPPLGTCREVIWLKGATRHLHVEIAVESLEAQPRRHIIHVKRQIPALTPVSTT